MKKITLLVFLFAMAAIAAIAQPQRMSRMMMPDYRNPDSTATVVAKEMKLDDDLNARFIPLYVTYLNEYKKIDELMPMRFNRQRGQRPTEEEMQQMRQTMETRESIITEMRKIYEQKFTDLLGAEKYALLQSIEKEQSEKRLQKMMQRGGRRGGHRENGGFPGGGFPGGGNAQGGGFPGGF